MKNNLNKIFAIIWGQCISGVQSVSKEEANFEQEEGDVNCLCLLKNVKKITAGIDNKDNKKSMLHEALISFFTMRQGETDSKNLF